jgi:hypothetical protein
MKRCLECGFIKSRDNRYQHYRSCSQWREEDEKEWIRMNNQLPIKKRSKLG